MKKECDHCGLDEIVLVSSMYWAKMEFRFVRCLACSTEAYYANDESGDVFFISSDIFKRVVEWFGESLGAADYDLRLKDKEKGEIWRESPPYELFRKMKRHIHIVESRLLTLNHHAVDVHSIKIANYALMIATRVVQIRKEADEENGETDDN